MYHFHPCDSVVAANLRQDRGATKLSITDLLAPLCGDELWLSEAVLDAEGGTLSEPKVEALREDGDNASQFTACPQGDLASSEDDVWTEELSNSDDEGPTWEDLDSVDTHARGVCF
eukprot:6488520-Amphidinium_carterae.1